MSWKASHEHDSKGETAKIGSTHFDIYHTDKSGNRDQPHHTDVKISGESHSIYARCPSVQVVMSVFLPPKLL